MLHWKCKCTEYIVIDSVISHAKTGVNDNIICRVCLNQIYLNKQLSICEILLVHSDTWKCAKWGHITCTNMKKHDKMNMGLQLQNTEIEIQ